MMWFALMLNRSFVPFLLALAAFSGVAVSAQDPGDPPGAVTPLEISPETATETTDQPLVEQETWSSRIVEIEAKIVEASNDPADAGLLTSLKERRAKLQDLVAGERRRLELLAEIAGASAREVALKNEFGAVDVTATEPIDSEMTRDELEDQVRDLERSSDGHAARLQIVRNALDSRERRREALREEQQINIQALAEISGFDGEGRSLDRIREERLPQIRTLIELERKMLDVTGPSLRLESKILETKLEVSRLALSALRARLTQIIADEATRSSDAALEELDESASEVVREQLAINGRLAARLSELILESHAIEERIESTRKRLDEIKRDRITDGQRFGGLTTPAIAKLLRERESLLPDRGSINAKIRRARGLIPTLQVESLVLESDLERTSSITSEADRLIRDSGLKSAAAEIARTLLIPVLENRVEEFGLPLTAVLNTRIDLVSQELGLLMALAEESGRYESLVLQKTLWIRDGSTFSPGAMASIRVEMASLFHGWNWSGLGGVGLEAVLGSPLRFSFLVVLPPVLILTFRRRIRRRVLVAGQRVTLAASDSFSETLLVVLFALLQTLAWSLPIMILGGMLQGPLVVDQFGRAIGAVLELISIFFFLLLLILTVVQHGGLAEMHFRWSTRLIREVRLGVWLAMATLPFGFLERLCDPSRLDLTMAARVFFTPIPLLLAFSAYLIFQPRRGVFGDDGDGEGNPAGPLLRWGMPSFLIGLLLTNSLMVNLGWYRLIATVQRNVVLSLMLVVMVLLVRELLFRALYARQRGATWLLRRQEVKGEDVSAEVGKLAAIEVRTVRAIRFCVVTVSLIGFWLVWSDLLPAFRFLSDITLWQSGEDDFYQPITLLDGVFCFVAIVGTYYTTRNLPAILELLVLERLAMDRGMRYACSQIFQWAILIGGFAFSVSILGISWASVQWLAAGFTVGLGFGLQEIFANFISGLIILFEQPVRVGDLVSVGETTGTIERIRMRSTTITDWDRKELVVPNKQFITQEVVNWSMGDACIRLVLPIGVSYRENPRDIVRYLSEIASAHPDVLPDPEPNIAFRAFSDSSLDFDLRVYLPGTDRMAAVRTDLNIAIKERFDAEGVVIPFPQRDVRVEMVRSGEAESGPAIPLPLADQRSDSGPGTDDRVGRGGLADEEISGGGDGPDGDEG